MAPDDAAVVGQLTAAGHAAPHQRRRIWTSSGWTVTGKTRAGPMVFDPSNSRIVTLPSDAVRSAFGAVKAAILLNKTPKLPSP